MEVAAAGGVGVGAWWRLTSPLEAWWFEFVGPLLLRRSDEPVRNCASCPRSVVTTGVAAAGGGGGGGWAAAAGPGGGPGGVFPSWLVLDEPVVWDGFERAAAHAAAEEVGLKHGFSQVVSTRRGGVGCIRLVA